MKILLLLLLIPSLLGSSDLGWLSYPCPVRAIRAPRTSIASYYHPDLSGGLMASCGRYMPSQLMAANKTLPWGTRLTLCRADRPLVCVQVTILDRGPYISGRDFDVSLAVARKLGMIKAGLCRVTARRAEELP